MRQITRWLMHKSNGPLTVALIGAGGNGSEIFDGLIRIDQGLRAMDSQGLHVTVIDDDEVSESNTVRQRFYPHEVGQNKAVALVHRANVTFGLNWKAHPHRAPIEKLQSADLIITAVDNVSTRQQLAQIDRNATRVLRPGARADELAPGSTLWLDMGVDRDQGQMVLGALGHDQLNAPLPNVMAHFPALASAEEAHERPSCSAADSLARQDLMVNQQIAGAATNLLWKALRTGQVPYNGVMMDLSMGSTSPIAFFPLPEANRHDAA